MALLGPTETVIDPGCVASLGITATGGSTLSCSTSGGSACQSVGATQYGAQ
jgi:hypothetical protein